MIHGTAMPERAAVTRFGLLQASILPTIRCTVTPFATSVLMSNATPLCVRAFRSRSISRSPARQHPQTQGPDQRQPRRFRACGPDATVPVREDEQINNEMGGSPMRSALLLVAGIAVVLAAREGLSTARAQQMDFEKIAITTDQMAPNLYMLSGSSGIDPSHDDAAGGRIGILAGPDGVFMVDAQ